MHNIVQFRVGILKCHFQHFGVYFNVLNPEHLKHWKILVTFPLQEMKIYSTCLYLAEFFQGGTEFFQYCEQHVLLFY